MNYRFLIEFVGTYITCLLFILFTNEFPSKKLCSIILALGSACFLPIILFYNISYDFNPSITLMFWLDGERNNLELVTFISSQLIAGWAAYETIKLIKFKNIL